MPQAPTAPIAAVVPPSEPQPTSDTPAQPSTSGTDGPQANTLSAAQPSAQSSTTDRNAARIESAARRIAARVAQQDFSNADASSPARDH